MWAVGVAGRAIRDRDWAVGDLVVHFCEVLVEAVSCCRKEHLDVPQERWIAINTHFIVVPVVLFFLIFTFIHFIDLLLRFAVTVVGSRRVCDSLAGLTRAGG